MKTTILVIVLTCGCVVSTYSQINQKRKGDRLPNNRASFHSIKPAFDYSGLIKPNDVWDDKTVDSFLSKDNWYVRAQEKASVQESMPCYKPEGVFSMRIIQPDSRTAYTMLLKKVLGSSFR